MGEREDGEWAGDKLNAALRDLLDAVMDTLPARLLLRFVDWYPGLQRRPWARKYRT